MPKKTRDDERIEQEIENKIKAKFAKWDKKSHSSNNGGGMLYFVGFIGAFVYYMQAAGSFSEVVMGILKALVWPAIIVYKLLESFYGIV